MQWQLQFNLVAHYGLYVHIRNGHLRFHYIRLYRNQEVEIYGAQFNNTSLPHGNWGFMPAPFQDRMRWLFHYMGVQALFFHVLELRRCQFLANLWVGCECFPTMPPPRPLAPLPARGGVAPLSPVPGP